MQENTILNGVQLGVFVSRIEAVCDEMGAVLQRAAFSPNIKDRLDFSCAVFDAQGELCAQAAHIPVHLGSMAFAMADIVGRIDWSDGDMVVLNDPFLGGTHLPDITLIAPVFIDAELLGFVVNRAHHANIGSDTPGSMPLSTCLDEEGIIIEPQYLLKKGQLVDEIWQRLSALDKGEQLSSGDFSAQISANRCGVSRMEELIRGFGKASFQASLLQLNAYGERIARRMLGTIPDGTYCFEDWMDDDGAGQSDIVIRLAVTVSGSDVCVDFAGTAAQVRGNINCPLSVAAAAVFYVFRSLMPVHAPACAGLFRPIHISAPLGCLLNARRPAAVTAGNVETSSRIVDTLLGALAQALPAKIPAASQGTMNNIAMGSISRGWNYYETAGGGTGGGPGAPGLNAVQSHMTNTRNTPIESLELHYPMRIRRYQLRCGSGGEGRYAGGEGLVREFEFLEDTQLTLLTERRRHSPWGMAGGQAGKSGENRFNGRPVPVKCQLQARCGDRLLILTPGGGGWGKKL